MSGISAWALSIVGVVLLGLLIDVVMPEGQTNKYIKGVFGIMTVFVIAAPLPKLMKNELNLADIFGLDANYEVDTGFIENLNRQKVDAMKKNAADALAASGYSGVEFSVTWETKENKLSVIRIFVDVSEGSYQGNSLHNDKNIDDEMKKFFSNIFGISRDLVSVYG